MDENELVLYRTLTIQEQWDWGLGLLADAFRVGATRLEDSADLNGFDNSSLPICSLYKQAIEVYLSSLAVLIYCPRFEISYNPAEPLFKQLHIEYDKRFKTHNIKYLASEISNGLRAAGKVELCDEFLKLQDALLKIYSIDPDGFFFRYPLSKPEEKFEYSHTSTGSVVLFPGRLDEVKSLLRDTTLSLEKIYIRIRQEIATG